MVKDAFFAREFRGCSLGLRLHLIQVLNTQASEALSGLKKVYHAQGSQRLNNPPLELLPAFLAAKRGTSGPLIDRRS